ncbi:neutral zinc metallopeptidase [Tsukamurella pseudospumae]|nr:neutral zinc metallopeptidase [Tsukamurella pseudospumae]
MGNPYDPRGRGYPRPGTPAGPPPPRRVPVPPPAQAPRPAPAHGLSGQYRISAGVRRPTVPPRPAGPVRPYAPSYGPGAARPGVPRPQVAQPAYRPVPQRPVPAAPPRVVPPAQWSMPAPYRGPAGNGAPVGYGRPVGYGAPAWAPVPPVRSGGGPWVAVLVVAIVVLIALLLGVAVLALAGRSTVDTGASPTGAPGGPVTTSEATSTTPAAATRTTSQRGTTGSSVSAGSTPTGTAALQGNPLFANANAGLPTQPCTATGWPSDSAAGKRFFDSVAPCLDRAWQSATEGAGLSYRKPTVLVPSGTKLSSPCGTTDLATENVAAFYCPSNETLYMPPSGLEVDRYGNQPVIYLSVFAHEYGHHVQRVTGILAAEVRLERQYGRTSDRGLEVSRRTELQAQCFSGMLVKSVSDTGGQFTSRDYRTAFEDQERGDQPGSDRDHGTSAHAQGWWNTGYQTNRLARCNTWAASSNDVA